MVNPIPDGYHTITPYLIVEDPRKLLEFTKAAFGAVVDECMDAEDGNIRHAGVQIGTSKLMMGGALEPSKPTSTMLYLYVENRRGVQAGACGGRRVDAGTHDGVLRRSHRWREGSVRQPLVVRHTRRGRLSRGADAPRAGAARRLGASARGTPSEFFRFLRNRTVRFLVCAPTCMDEQHAEGRRWRPNSSTASVRRSMMKHERNTFGMAHSFGYRCLVNEASALQRGDLPRDAQLFPHAPRSQEVTMR